MIQHQTMVDKYQKSSSAHKIKYYFQGQCAISKHLFKLDLDWTEENFQTRETEFFKMLYQNI